MKEFLNKLTNQRPYLYGLWYLGLIPLYAIIFTALPESSLNLNNHNTSFFTNLYFSIITITTLGYGDITPIGRLSQFLTASESVLGIILIGLFLNSLSHQHGIEVQKHERQIQQIRKKEQAIERFSAFNQLVELRIKRYTVYLIPIITPLSAERKGTPINENFSFNDMQDLFQTTLRLTDDYSTPAVEYYFESLKELVASLEELVKLGYAQSWPEIEGLCLEFISVSKDLDFSASILNQPNIRMGDKKVSDFYAEMIKNHKGEVKYIQGNGINSYVALYHLIHNSFSFMKNYRQMASKIIEDKQN